MEHCHFSEIDVEGINDDSILHHRIPTDCSYILEMKGYERREFHVDRYVCGKPRHMPFEGYYARMSEIRIFQNLQDDVSKFADPILRKLVHRDRNNHLFVLPPHILREISEFLKGLATFFTV